MTVPVTAPELSPNTEREQPDYYERSEAMTWVAITCAEREALVNGRPGGRYEGMSVASSRTDDEVIYTEWYEKATDTPLLRDWRYPGYREGADRKPCEHKVPEEQRP